MAAILIPTMNRADFLQRLLAYLAGQRCGHTLYVGDSSGPEFRTRIESACKAYRDRLNIEVLWTEPRGTNACFLALLERVKEKYVCYIGDDDFVVPATVVESERFLDANPTYASAQGYAYLISLDGPGPWGHLSAMGPYPQRELTSVTAVDRVKRYFESYYCSLFSVTSTALLRDACARAARNPDKTFRDELVASTTLIAAGRSKLLPVLGYVRQSHPGRYLLSGHREWLEASVYPEARVSFVAEVSDTVARVDGIPSNEACRVVEEAFRNYERALRQKASVPRAPESLSERLFRSSGWVRSLARARRSWMMRVGKGRFAPLSPNSPGARELRAICDTLRSSHG